MFSSCHSAQHRTPGPACRRLARAFTLLELLAVLVILALLALTLLPALARTGPNTRALQCLNNQRQMCAAWRMYADDNRDRIVYSSDDGTAPHPQNQYAWTWSHLDFNPNNRANWDITYDITQRPLWPYVGKNPALYRCPSDPSFVVVGGVAKQRVRSISMNFYLGGFAGTDGGLPYVTPYRIFFKTTELTAPSPAKAFVFLDMRPEVIGWGNFLTDMTGYSPSNPATYVFVDFPNLLHDSACCLSFADGRSEIHRWTDPRTIPVLNLFIIDGGPTTASPRNPDIAWLQDHATRPK
jgi:prepilin-type N-terminal cleavage/methylation domain-containing protein